MAYNWTVDNKNYLYKDGRKLNLNDSKTYNAVLNDPTGQKLLQRIMNPSYTDPDLKNKIDSTSNKMTGFIFQPTKFNFKSPKVIDYEQALGQAEQKYQPLIDASRLNSAQVAQQQQHLVPQAQAAIGELRSGGTTQANVDISSMLVRTLAEIDREGASQKASMAQGLVKESKDEAAQAMRDAVVRWQTENQIKAEAANSGYNVTTAQLKLLTDQRVRDDAAYMERQRAQEAYIDDEFNMTDLNKRMEVAYAQIKSTEGIAAADRAAANWRAQLDFAASRASSADATKRLQMELAAAAGEGTAEQAKTFKELFEETTMTLGPTVGTDGKFDKEAANNYSNQIRGYGSAGLISPAQEKVLLDYVRGNYPHYTAPTASPAGTQTGGFNPLKGLFAPSGYQEKLPYMDDFFKVPEYR